MTDDSVLQGIINPTKTASLIKNGKLAKTL
jgi:hypothetical protein